MKFLIFGGNGFIGWTFVEELLRRNVQNEHHLLLANRCHWEWNIKEKIRDEPNIKCVYYDRKKSLQQSPDFMKATAGQYFDYVIDFSAYKKTVLRGSLEALQGHFGLYILISTDSVYEVCDIPHDGPSREYDAVRPSGEELNRKLRRKDSYGHKKLQCEEELITQHREHGCDYLILRLADVIGPRDSTERFPTYLIGTYIARHLMKPMYIPSGLSKKMLSFVFSEDIARLLADVVTGKTIKEATVNQVYNLACRETVKIQQLLQMMSDALPAVPGQGDLKIESSTNEEVPWIYPSVDRGPIDTTKAISNINWDPASVQDAVIKTTRFYVDICKDETLTKERKELHRTVIEDLQPLYKCDLSKYVKSFLKI